MSDVLVINLQMSHVVCCMCGREDLSKWGIPISMETGLVVSNEFVGEWGGRPACRKCWKKHEIGMFVGHETRY